MENKKTTKEKVFILWIERISLVEGLSRFFVIGIIVSNSVWMFMSAEHIQPIYAIYAGLICLSFTIIAVGLSMIFLRSKYIKAAEKDETLDQKLKEEIIKKLKIFGGD